MKGDARRARELVLDEVILGMSQTPWALAMNVYAQHQEIPYSVVCAALLQLLGEDRDIFLSRGRVVDAPQG